ncbi:MAG: hypothetical protein ACUVQ9_13425 [Thermodesulfobacteriota bacterium]
MTTMGCAYNDIEGRCMQEKQIPCHSFRNDTLFYTWMSLRGAFLAPKQSYYPVVAQGNNSSFCLGEFTIEFLLVVTELMAIQERTNYPEGSLTEILYRNFGFKDRFSVIQKAILKRLK